MITDTDWITVLIFRREDEENVTLHLNRDDAVDHLLVKYAIAIEGMNGHQIDELCQDLGLWITIRELPAP